MNTRHNEAARTAVVETERDILGVIALAAAALSFAGFAVLVVGHLADPTDFNNGKNPSPANNVAFFAFVLGLLVALGLGGAVWYYGRRTQRTGPRSPAALATYYGAAALVVAIIGAALGA